MEENFSKIGKYEVIGVLGRGAMGVVYKAKDPEIGREVAIKTLRALQIGEQSRADAALERFKTEARSAGNLRHPNIITIFEVNRQDNVPYMVMDYVEGQSLDTAIQKNGRLEPALALRCIAQVASGLDYAHSRGVVHRDIKPGNLFLDQNGTVYILDFGVALITESLSKEEASSGGIVVGSPGYMSPEQILNKTITPRSDLFSLGAVAFECFTGKRPFAGENFSSVVSNILSGKPRSLTQLVPELPLALEAEFERALAKDESKRFPSATAMAEAFSLALGISMTEKRMKREKLEPGGRKRAPSIWQPFKPKEVLKEAELSWETGLTETPEGEAVEQGGGDILNEQPGLITGKPFSGAEEVRDKGGDFEESADDNSDEMELRPRISTGGIEASIAEAMKKADERKRRMLAVCGCLFLIAGIGISLWVFDFPGNATVIEENAGSSGVKGGISYAAPPSGVLINNYSDREVMGALLSEGVEESVVLDAIKEAQERKLPDTVEALCKMMETEKRLSIRLEAIRVLGESGDRLAVKTLLECLGDGDPVIRGYAARALGNLGETRALDVLKVALGKETTTEVKKAMEKAIARLGG